MNQICIVILLFIFSLISCSTDLQNNLVPDEVKYVEGCKLNLKEVMLNVEDRLKLCECNHSFEYRKYGEAIYSDTPKIDVIELLNELEYCKVSLENSLTDEGLDSLNDLIEKIKASNDYANHS